MTTALAKTAPEEGFALIDAMTALMILSITIALSISAAVTAGRLARSASDTRALQVRIASLLDWPLEQVGALDDSDRAQTWRVELRRTGNVSGQPVCERQVVVKSRTSNRTYRAATIEPCPIGTEP